MDLKTLLEIEDNQLKYIKNELDCSKFHIDEIQELITGYHFTLGRISLVEDLIKEIYGYNEREFRVRQKKGTLFEETKKG